MEGGCFECIDSSFVHPYYTENAMSNSICEFTFANPWRLRGAIDLAGNVAT